MENKSGKQDHASCQLERTKTFCDTTSSILGEIDTAISFLDDLETKFQQVSTKTNELSKECEVLVKKQVRILLSIPQYLNGFLELLG